MSIAELAFLVLLGVITLLALIRGRRIQALEDSEKLLQDKIQNQEWIIKEQGRMIGRKAKEGYQLLKGQKVDKP